MLGQFLLYRKVNQLYMRIHPFFLAFLSYLGHYRALSRVPCAIQRVLTSYLFYTQLWVVQSLSHVRLFATPWTAEHPAFLPFTISWSLLKLQSIEWVLPSNHLVLCYPLLLLPSIFPSIRVFSNEFALCLRYWRFSFGISPFFEYSRLISFRIDCLISLQYHSINSVYVSISIFQFISPAPPSGIHTSTSVSLFLLCK